MPSLWHAFQMRKLQDLDEAVRRFANSLTGWVLNMEERARQLTLAPGPIVVAGYSARGWIEGVDEEVGELIFGGAKLGEFPLGLQAKLQFPHWGEFASPSGPLDLRGTFRPLLRPDVPVPDSFIDRLYQNVLPWAVRSDLSPVNAAASLLLIIFAGEKEDWFEENLGKLGLSVEDVLKADPKRFFKKKKRLFARKEALVYVGWGQEQVSYTQGESRAFRWFRRITRRDESEAQIPIFSGLIFDHGFERPIGEYSPPVSYALRVFFIGTDFCPYSKAAADWFTPEFADKLLVERGISAHRVWAYTRSMMEPIRLTFRIEQTPAFIVTDVEGREIARKEGFISEQSFITWISRIKEATSS